MILDLRALPAAVVASVEEVDVLIESPSLVGLGIGYVDAALLASVTLWPGTRLWTRDRRLAAIEDMLLGINRG